MLNFKLRHVVAYIPKSGIDLEKAVREFFGEHELTPEIINQKEINSLFNEWLIFDYKLPSGISIAADYYFKNPDQFSKELMDELKQIIETQTYEFLELEKVQPGEWVEVYGLFSGRRYKVLEKTFSVLVEERQGCFFNRIAYVDGNYYFIGSNPTLLPLAHTDRSKRLYLRMKKQNFTAKDALAFLLPSKENKKEKDDKYYLKIKGGIQMKRKKLKKQFKNLKKKFHFRTSFFALIDFIYNEKYKSHFANYHKDLTKLGISEEIIFNQVKFFQDMWNFFPHKNLNGKCPAEKFKEAYGV